MERKGVTDAELAAIIGRDRTMVNRIRRGLVRPTLDLAAVIETATAGEVSMQSWADATHPNKQVAA